MVDRDNLPETIRLKGGVKVWASTPNSIQCRVGTWSSPILSFWDEEETGKLGEFVEILKEEADTERILERLDDDEVGDFLEFVNELEEQDLLETTGQIATDTSFPNSVENYFNLAVEEPETRLQDLREKKVAVVGCGIIGSRVARQLAELRVASVVLSDGREVTEDDIPLGPAVTEESIRSNRAEEVSSWLGDRWPDTSFSVENVETDQVGELFEKADHVIVAEDHPNPVLYTYVNRASLETEKPWTLVRTDNVDCTIGPTFYPYETACYICMQRRLKFNLQESEPHGEYLRYLSVTDEDDRDDEFSLLPGHADVIAGFVGSILPQVIGGVGPTAETAITFSFFTNEFSTERVLKFPRCPACGVQNRRDREIAVFGPTKTITLEDDPAPQHMERD